MEIKKISNSTNALMQLRSSIRKYDPTVKISREEMAHILQDAMTAPSSLNLQPWRFVVVDSDEGKSLIQPLMMFNQQQCETSSAVIAVFADTQCVESAEAILNADVENSLKTVELKDKMLEKIREYTSSYTPERLSNSLMMDMGFVCMQLMLAAKGYGYDTNPIGGFMRKELAEALGMDIKRYIPALVITIGKAAEPAKDSTRFSVSEVTQWK